MKKILLVLEFFFICVFLIIPPLFVKTGNFSYIELGISWSTLINLIVAMYLFYAYEIDSGAGILHKKSGLSFLLNAGKVFLYFGILISISSILNLGALFFKISQINTQKEFILKSNLLSVLLNFLVSAFYEECLYRLYLPEILTSFFIKFEQKYFYNRTEIFQKRILLLFRFLVEITCILIFGFSHSYMGNVALINAVLCGAVLRFCFVRNKTVFIGALSHFIFNSFTLLSVLL